MATTFNNANARLSTTSITDVYQASTATGAVSVILSIMVANVNGTASADITISKTDSANTLQSYLAYTIPVPNDTSLECVANKIVLKAGEKIRATASAANYLDVIVSGMDIV